MNHPPRRQVVHLVFHLPADQTASAASDWSLVELARRHAPDLAAGIFGEAVGRLTPHFVGIVLFPPVAAPAPDRRAADVRPGERRPFAG